jgi:hypothetical protein
LRAREPPNMMARPAHRIPAPEENDVPAYTFDVFCSLDGRTQELIYRPSLHA